MMKRCCRDTYIQTVEEVINHIQSCKHKSFGELIGTLQYAVDMLKEKKLECGPLIFNEWKKFKEIE